MKYFSTFSGIGGFELGINQAYEVCNVDGSALGRIQTNTQRDEGQGFLSKKREDTSPKNGQFSQCVTDKPNQRPFCAGYCEIDKYAIKTYEHHFPDHRNYGDITKIDAAALPDFDLLVGGFPCQAFSVAGKRAGFLDKTRGTLFFDLCRILDAKRPRHFVFENVKGLLSHDKGQTFDTIIATLDDLGYDLQWQVLNSKDFGVPQNRERVFIVGHLRGEPRPEVFPICSAVREDTRPDREPAGINNPSRGYEKRSDGIGSCVRAGESGTKNIIHDGLSVRKLTPTECERLQGFPDAWTLGSDTQRYKQCGNAVTVNVVQKVMQKLYNLPQ